MNVLDGDIFSVLSKKLFRLTSRNGLLRGVERIRCMVEAHLRA
jgi:hypothetical protein